LGNLEKLILGNQYFVFFILWRLAYEASEIKIRLHRIVDGSIMYIFFLMFLLKP